MFPLHARFQHTAPLSGATASHTPGPHLNHPSLAAVSMGGVCLPFWYHDKWRQSWPAPQPVPSRLNTAATPERVKGGVCVCGGGGGGQPLPKVNQSVLTREMGVYVFQPQNKFGYERFSGSEDLSLLDNARTHRNTDT